MCPTKDAAFELPVHAFASELDVASPLSPELPEMASGLDVESPEVAEPYALELESAWQESPPLPESPVVTVGSAVASPELPESPLLPESPDVASVVASPLFEPVFEPLPLSLVVIAEPAPVPPVPMQCHHSRRPGEDGSHAERASHPYWA